MNGQKLFFAAFLSCCCTFSYAQQSSGAICDTEIYPKPSPDESVLPSLADGDTSGDSSGGSTTDKAGNPSKPQGSKDYYPESSAPGSPKGQKDFFPPESTAPTTPTAPATPKSEKEYYPSASSNQNKSNSKKASR